MQSPRAAQFVGRTMCRAACAAPVGTAGWRSLASCRTLPAQTHLADAGTSPSDRYALLCAQGSIQHDPHQERVVGELDTLYAQLPTYQEGMVAHSAGVQAWLHDWNAARDCMVRERLKVQNFRISTAPMRLLQEHVVLPFATACEDGFVPAVLPTVLSAPLAKWAKVRLAEAKGLLIIHEDDIDAEVGRSCPAPPPCPQGMYLPHVHVHGTIDHGATAHFPRHTIHSRV